MVTERRRRRKGGKVEGRIHGTVIRPECGLLHVLRQAPIQYCSIRTHGLSFPVECTRENTCLVVLFSMTLL
jgi:hypothetical protein